MSKEIDNDNKDHDPKQDYMLSKEENQVLLSILYLDLKNICHKIEDNFSSNKGSSV